MTLLIEWQTCQTGGRRRQHKNPAVLTAFELQLPRLPGELGDLSKDDAEKDAKRPRSTSTTPKSGKGLQPDEYDRLMALGSVEFLQERIGVEMGVD